MKIAIISHASPYSGLGQYAFDLCQGLRRYGEEADIIFFERIHSLLKEQQEWMEKQPWIKKIDQKLRLSIPVKNLQKKLFFPFFYYYYLKKVPDGYDIYHAPHSLYARLAKYKKPCVITYMDREPILFPETFASLYRFLWKMQFSYFKEAEMIIATCQDAKQELLEMNVVPEENIRVVNQGFNNSVYKPLSKKLARNLLNFSEDKKIVLCVATENPRKNISTLLKAMHIVQKRIPNVILIKIGSRNQINDELKKDLAILEFQGIPEEKMPYFYNAADLFVLPTAYDMVPYPVQEAMGCGTPIITTHKAGMNKKGYLPVPVYDEKILAENICHVLTDSKKQKMLSEEALKEAKNWTLDVSIQQIQKIYQEVINKTKEK